MATRETDTGAGVHFFPAERAAVGAARGIASDVGGLFMSADRVYDLQLAVTEVVSNAVRHSGSGEEIRLQLSPCEGYLCVRVTDGGAGLVPRPGAMGSEEGAGFGLFIVEQLTRRWGMTREGGRTRVWFEMDYTAAGGRS